MNIKVIQEIFSLIDEVNINEIFTKIDSLRNINVSLPAYNNLKKEFTHSGYKYDFHDRLKVIVHSFEKKLIPEGKWKQTKQEVYIDGIRDYQSEKGNDCQGDNCLVEIKMIDNELRISANTGWKGEIVGYDEKKKAYFGKGSWVNHKSFDFEIVDFDENNLEYHLLFDNKLLKVFCQNINPKREVPFPTPHPRII